ncbi:organic hydroperoxide resistance protein [Leifsonia naganoensis]|uniref:Ohr subfamily peroxiredoxin n=1 Tax=Leifsonia naganoensis TaxID=150025 RepID=A0A853DLR1_9MICO|nr:organic hydroperoxide resistance protein [Leifsonia naganoensis]NYK09197.1 Ohr subfamily peroxiredoxin [Leifsonia naganoensis]
MRSIYTVEAIATGGGRDGHVRSTDGRVDLDLAVPQSMGGSGNGSNPEQLFAAGYSACFHSAVQLVARQRKIDISGSSVGGQISLLADAQGALRLAVLLEVVLPGVEQGVAESLAEAAHQVCPYSNATRGNIEVTIVVADD